MTQEAETLMNSHETAELLGRLDERTKGLPKTLSDIDRKVENASRSLNDKIDSHDERLGKVEVTVATAIESISPLKRLVYGAVGIILTAMILATISVITTRTAQDTHVIESAVNKAVDSKLGK